MLIYIKLAWRNVLRNKRRTFIAGSAIGLGLACLILTDALIIGMEHNMIHSATASFLGEAQIHRDGFRQEWEVDKTIKHLDNVIGDLSGEEIVDEFTLRTIAFAMISSPANVSAISMVGINPETEQQLSQIDDAIVRGDYFGSGDRNNIVIGNKLAELLEVELNDRVVLTVAQAKTGDLSQEMFRISGIYSFNITDLDRAMAFIRIEEAQNMLNLGNNAHEIAVKFNDIKLARDPALSFWGEYSNNGNEAVSWTTLLPALDIAFKLSWVSKIVLGIILFAIISLGIINTLFMSLHERMFEFGVLRAIGTHPFAMGRLIFFEAGALAVIAVLIGMGMGYLVTSIFAHAGIDYRGIEFAGATYREILYPVMTILQFIAYPVVVFILTVTVALIPAWHAARMKPAEAMRKSF
jgi:ABC-type lipoprotein release transport system permease subunit